MDEKFKKEISSAITDIKITQVKQAANHDRMNEILEKLTESVEYHIQRSDNLEKLVELYKKDNETQLNEELAPIKSHVSFVKGAFWALSICCVIVVTMYEMGIIQKLI